MSGGVIEGPIKEGARSCMCAECRQALSQRLFLRTIRVDDAAVFYGSEVKGLTPDGWHINARTSI